jgi:NAD(P)-dependent dehydrogenase (short-subunit alcohol dehydrogenase family)
MNAPKEMLALVTGGSSGIGKAIVTRLSQMGGRVVFTYSQNETEARDLARQLGEERVIAVRIDLRETDEIARVTELCESRYGRLDALINNAAIQGPRAELLQHALADWQETVAVNLTAVFRLTQLAIPLMLRHSFGRIVNISSVAAQDGYPLHAPYAATKAALIGFTKSLAKELAPANINVNAVLPGITDTRMAAKLSSTAREAIVSAIPMKRMAMPDEVADLVAFLVLPDSRYITGECIRISGGR